MLMRLKILGRRCCFVFIIFLCYLILGGFLFQALEHESREDYIEESSEEIEENRAELLKALWAETIAKNEEDWAFLANQRIDLYEKSLKEYILQGIDPQDEERSNPWSFIGSIFYSFTVLTTIGYGNIYPITVCGKLLTIVYGLLGIPLTLILITEMGKFLTLALKGILRKRWQDYDSTEDFNFTPIIAIVLTILYLLLGTLIFDFLEEDWDFVQSSYFVFITFSTIGFGDVLPSSEFYMLLLMVYNLSALSMCAMCFTVIENFVESHLSATQNKVMKWWDRKKDQKREAESKKTDEPSEQMNRRDSPPIDSSTMDQFSYIPEADGEEEEVEEEEIEDDET